MWTLPKLASRNGEIVSYTINVSVVESEEMFQYITNTTELELLALRPYHTYVFTVAASTIIGEGPFSSNVTIQTPEDGKLIDYDHF